MVENLNCLISAGPTREWIDPVRFISNPSSGKMGYALAKEAYIRNFNVKLISGPVTIPPIKGVDTTFVETSKEMYRAMLAEFSKADIVIMCAAVCDHRPKKIWREKIKKHEFPKTVEFEKTDDILYELGKNKGKNQKLIGFAAETENCENNAIDKLKRKNLDWIALNDISKQDIGFQSDFNQLTLFSRDKREILLEHSSKEKLAKLFFEKIIK